VDLSEAISNYRLATFESQLEAARYQGMIPKSNPIAAAKVVWKGLGVAAAVGTAIYSFVSDGPGIVWEDTAAQAWETGGDAYEDCVMRHLHEVWPESIPAPEP
jgi:hypothetical protein